MAQKARHWLSLILWTSVAFIAICVIWYWVTMDEVDLLTYLLGVMYILLSVGLVLVLQKHYGWE